MLGHRTHTRKFSHRRGGRARKVKKSKRPAYCARPGFEGTRELCRVTVESPHRKGKYVEVTKNVHGSWSSVLRTQGHIDAAQEKAADHFRWLYEQRWSNMVLDAWRIIVKKKSLSGYFPHQILTTGQKLAAAQRRIGSRRFSVLELMCGGGLTLQEATRRYFGRHASRRDEARFLQLLLSALDELALHWGYVTPRGSGVETSQPRRFDGGC